MTKPIYLFLDTNNWIYLANGFNPYSKKHDDIHLKVFSLLQQRAEQGQIAVLVNDMVLDEFERNKSQIRAKILDIENKRDGYLGSLKPLKEFISETDPNIAALEKTIIDTADNKIARMKKHNFEVELFLNKWTISIPVTDQQKIRAVQMAVDKKAPFTGDKKNSMADALHILSFTEFVEANMEKIQRPIYGPLPSGYFVTSNSGDFSHPKDRELIHPDLAPILEQANSKFYYVLHRLINELEEEFLDNAEQQAVEAAQEWDYCIVCERGFEKEHFSDYFKLLDPHQIKGGSRDENQLGLFKEIIIRPEHPYIYARTISCHSCWSLYFECGNCNSLVLINDRHDILECPECYYLYKSNFGEDRDGKVIDLGYEILETIECRNCGQDFQELNKEGFCTDCWEYELLMETFNDQ